MKIEKMAERRVMVQGVSTVYYDAGEGPVILFLHGNATSARDWWRLMAALASTHRVLAPALPGYGDTGPVGDERPDRLVSFIDAFLDEVGVDRVIAGGQSYGGLLAAEFALAHPERVTRLMLAASAGLGRVVHPWLVAQSLIPVPISELLVAALQLPGGAVLRTFGTAALQLRQPWRVPLHFWLAQLRLTRSRTFLRTSYETVRSGVGLAGQRHDVSGRLNEIDVPTLIIWGLTDSIFPVWQGVRAARRLPSGAILVIPGGGHACHLECHEEFLDALGPFVRDELVAS